MEDKEKKGRYRGVEIGDTRGVWWSRRVPRPKEPEGLEPCLKGKSDLVGREWKDVDWMSGKV